MADYVSNKTIEKLKHDLVRDGLIRIEDLTRAEETSEKTKQNLAHVLIEENLVNEESLLKFIQDNLRIPYVNLDDYSLDKNCLAFISAEDAQKYRIIPLFKIENTLTIAMADPLDLFALNNLIKSVQCQIEPVICSEWLIIESIERHYLNKQTEKELEWNNEQTIVSSILDRALKEEIFEVIFEGHDVKVRNKGVIGTIPLLLVPLVLAHLKTLSGLDVNVFDIPQLGRFKYEDIVAVVSTFPSTKGERLTLKLYKPPKTIEELNLDIDLEKPGIILVTGPELSGKSFVAYSILNSLDPTKKNIMTIESIAKYELNGVTQCELNERVGFNIEKALRFIGFQSPDVIYFEEISSEELLKLAGDEKLIIAEMNTNNIPDQLNNIVATIIKTPLKL